ncbi:hypothetical protein GCM10008916_25370 [Clostridium nitritogenes]|uniref:Uncharacterized protein n=1 Tax=Clostridium nitritogenes TaxID=83340 RepID=A0ABN1LTJ7_9CLOT
MDFEKMQELIKDIISREASVEFEYDFKYMTEGEISEQKELVSKINKLKSELSKKLDKEDVMLLTKLVDALYSQTVLEGTYYFERGVRAGLTGLCYLKKYFTFF